MSHKVAALYVEKGGVYYGLPDVAPWDEERDARLYAGPYPVVAHPPCARWGRYWGGSPATWPRLKKGDDGGCFAAALQSVRDFSGVLEHPEGSAAWLHFGLRVPGMGAGWLPAGDFIGWTCRVSQGHYGHRATKDTLLYAVGCELPSLDWSRASRRVRLDDGYHSKEERRRAIRTGSAQRLSKRERAATPLPFRDLLLDMARSVDSQREVAMESLA